MPSNAEHTELARARFARALVGVGAVAGAILMVELALTRIFSVTMYYHFAFLAISIALFGLSASGVYVYVMRRTFDRRSTASLLTQHSLLFAVSTVLALAALVRIRVGLNYSHENLVKMIAIYLLAALPFFSGGAVISLAITRLKKQVNIVYAADLIGAAAGCLLLLPLLNRFGAPGVVLLAAVLGGVAALLFSPAGTMARTAVLASIAVGIPGGLQLAGSAPFDVSNTKGHDEDTVLFAKWNSFSRVAVYDRSHGDWSLSSKYKGAKPESRFMDIDSAASTPIVYFDGDLSKVEYLKYELTGLAFHLVGSDAGTLRGSDPNGSNGAESARKGTVGSDPFSVLVIGPGGGRDLLTALVFGASRVDGVEVNPIIANDVMRGRFRDFSGSIYQNPSVNVVVDDGRSFIRRSDERYDIIQASLVDTWAATAAGAYTLTENTLYTKEAFEDYYDHLTDRGMLTISRWVFDGLRLVSLAQAACESRGCSAADHIAIVQQDRVATFLFKKTPFATDDVERLRATSADLGFTVLYAPGQTEANNDYAKLVLAPDRQMFFEAYHHDVTPTTDNRPFFFHTTKIKDQFHTAFGRSMLFGNGLSALMTLMAISATFVTLFVVGPLVLSGNELRGSQWPRWLGVFWNVRRGLHADRGGAAAALRAVARPSGVLTDCDAVLYPSRHGHRQPCQPSDHRREAAAYGPARPARYRRRRDSGYRRATADHPRGDQRQPRRPHRPDRPADCPGGRADGDATAGGDPADDRKSFSPRTLGVGHERRAVGHRRDPGRLHRHELGFLGHPDDRGRHLPGGRCTSADFCR